MATLDDNKINTLQDVIHSNVAPAQANAQLDVWNTSTATPFVMTYQFESSQPADLWMSYGGWTAMSGAEQAAIRAVLDEYESVANVKFVQDNTLADPDTNFGKVSLSGEGGYGGWSFTLGWDGNNNITSKTMDHFAVFNNTLDLSAASNKNLLLHEIGHSMTLRHPGNYDVGGHPPDGPYLSAAEDNNKFSVMSYNANPDNGQFSDHLMLYDIAALQARWGANMSYHTGNDVYTGPNGNIQCIWDAGGTDTIDASGKTQAVTIDLHDGAFSSIGAVNNLSIAYGAIIENATGGAGADTLIGNDGANVLQGNGGNDTVNGAGGIDTFVLSGARSQYQVTNVNGTSVTLTDLRGSSPDGADTVSNVENFRFSDGTFSFAELTAPQPVAGLVTIGSATIVEGNNGTQMLQFTVARSGGTAAFSVNYATVDGTATTADGDYVATSNTLQFAANEMSKTISVAINGDTKVEANESFSVKLSNATNGATISGTGLGTGTIQNDDTAPAAGSVTIGDAMIVEGNNGTQMLQFTVARSGGTAAFSVNYATADGTATTADGDYVATSNTLQFAANEMSKTISVAINGDTKVEANETFSVKLSNATNGAAVSGTGLGTGIIQNDDTSPVAGSVKIGDAMIVEGNNGTQMLQFTVARSGGTAAFSINYATADGTATTADGDYVATSNTLQFAANEMSKTISVAINGDTKVEANETFSVKLSNATNGAIISGTGLGTGNIQNDDTAPVAGSITIGDAMIVEGNNGTQMLQFTVARSGGTAAFSVNYATADGTATTADGDYVATSNTLQFAANEMSKTISVAINGDTKVEANETFSVKLSNATNGATISGTGLGTGNIQNDDTAPVAGSVTIGDAMIVEGNNGTQMLQFTVARSGGTAAFSINYATADGTATTADGDYVATSNTLQFAANEMSKTISVAINGDTKVEANETFSVKLSNATNGATVSGTGLGTGIIQNDDTSPVAGSVKIGDAMIVEGNNGTQMLQFTVARSGGTAAFSINYATADGTATTADGDYVATSNTLQFAANEMSKTISVAINGDTKVEANETFAVKLSNATNGATISGTGLGTGTIQNDDAAVNHAPTVTGQNVTVVANGAISAASLFVAHDQEGDSTITQYAFWDSGSAGGHFVMNGVSQASGQWIYVNANNLGSINYVGGPGAGSETLYVSAYDGTAWSTNASLTAATTALRSPEDFNGDGNSDILLHNDNGSVQMWQMNGTQISLNQTFGTIGTTWSVGGTGDFNGDGKSDILWRNDNGSVAMWQMNGTQITTNQIFGTIATSWKVASVGDFSGDGKADILWQNDNGSVALWQMNGTQIVSNQIVGTVGSGFTILGSGDFNGDGKSDVLLQNSSGAVAMWQMNGSQIASSQTFGTIPTSWHFAGTGDFNGDAKSDILWRNDSGSVAMWQMNGTQIASNQVVGSAAANWHIADTGDYNNDGHSDILWQSDSGAVAMWEMNGTQLLANQAVGTASSGWHLF